MLTNKGNLALPLAMFLAYDDYDLQAKKPNQYSVTDLLKTTRQLILRERASVDETVELQDVTSRTSSAIGRAIHNAMEDVLIDSVKREKALQALGMPKMLRDRIVVNPDPQQDLPKNAILVYTEQRNEREIDGVIISGKYDLNWDGQVQDNKSTGVFTYTSKSKDQDYILQGSIYRWINPDQIFDDVMAINYLFTDWKQFEKLQRPDVYPPSDAHTQRFELMSLEDTELFVRSRVRELQAFKDKPESELPECDHKSLWMSDPVFKYYADPTKMTRSTKNFTNPSEAAAFKAKQGKGVIVEVKGQAKACLYCAGFALCSQKDKLIAEGLLTVKE